MIHFTSRRSRLRIRAWAQTGRIIPSRFPYLWDTRDSGTFLDFLDQSIARRVDSYIGVAPAETRRRYRIIRMLASILRRTGATLVVLSRQRAQAAGFRNTLEGIQILDQQFGKSGLPLSLVSAEVMNGTKWDRYAGTVQLWRDGYFLTGYDDHEGRRGYFLCELPPKEEGYQTVKEALEALKPEAVKFAEKHGRRVKRQGDLFFIPMKNFDPTEAASWKQWGTEFRESFIWDTNHAARSSVTDGEVVYVRGRVYHDPEDRQRDHKPVHLGKTWHLVVRNTVPIEARK